jgi:hypothetical protein
MTVHNALTGAELHETKGAAAALKGFTLVANGAGTAAYQALLGSVVFVNVLADLPTAAAGKITLAAATTYLFGADVNIGNNYLQFGAGTGISCITAFTAVLTYTGTVPMLQGDNVNARIKDITLNAPNGDLYSWVDSTPGTSIVIISDVLVLDCQTLGTFDDINTLVIDGSTVIECDSGIVLLGTNQSGLRLSSVNITSTSVTFIGLDFTGSTMKTVNLDGVTLAGGAGSIGIKGDAASANVTANFIANVSNVQFQGVTTPLSGITIDDVRWNFQGNGIVADTMPDAMVSMTSNATDTVLSVGVPTLVLGTFVSIRSSFFTNTTAGRATYNGERALVTPIDADITVEPVSGTNKSIRAFIAKNGVAILDSGRAILLDNNNPRQITVHWQLSMSATDYVEIFIENETDSTNATVIDATLRLR